jgi:hypothetical protein
LRELGLAMQRVAAHRCHDDSTIEKGLVQ